MTEIYLDHAATTPMLPEAMQAWCEVTQGTYANPSGAHRLARLARRALDEARERFAGVVGAKPGEIVFTSGGTEADNLAITGAIAAGGVGAAVPALCSAIEHDAVLAPVLRAGGMTVGVGADGVIDLAALDAALVENPDVAVVSVMVANNETGVIQPLAEVVELVRSRAPGALVHTDAVQGFAWTDIATVVAGADLISLSAHKFGGPKGTGVLVIREPAAVTPLVFGGGQEREFRPGTQDVAGAVAASIAAEIAARLRDERVAWVGARRDRLADLIVARVDDCTLSGTVDGRKPNRIAPTCHLCIDGVDAEALLFLLEREGISASAGSSCASGAQEPSHVLAAMGVDRSRAKGSLRLSLGPATTTEEVDAAAEAVVRSVAQLRAHAGEGSLA